MGIVKSWKDFIRGSLEVFSSKKKEDNAVAAVALKMFQEEIVGRKLTLPVALALLSDEEFTDGLIQDARQELEEQAGSLEAENSRRLAVIESKISTVTDVTTSIQVQNENLIRENAILHKKLDGTNEQLVAAKKRAMKYFKISLTMSVSSIALGIAMRYGAIDFVKDHIIDLFSQTLSVNGEIRKPPLLLPFESSHDEHGSSSILLKRQGPYGHCLPSNTIFGVYEAGRIITAHSDKGCFPACTRSNASLLDKRRHGFVRAPH